MDLQILYKNIDCTEAISIGFQCLTINWTKQREVTELTKHSKPCLGRKPIDMTIKEMAKLMLKNEIKSARE